MLKDITEYELHKNTYNNDDLNDSIKILESEIKGLKINDHHIDNTKQKDDNTLNKEKEEKNNEKIVKTDDFFMVFTKLLKELKVYCENALSKIHPMEMSGDSNKGITEMGFKLLLLGFFTNREESFNIVSERYVQGGRIDLLVEYIGKNKEVISILVIELKYNRIAFIKRSDEKVGENIKINKSQQSIWKEVNNSLPLDIRDENDLNVILLRDYFTNKDIFTGQPELTLIPLSKIFKDAKDQCLNYTFKLIQGNINPIKLKCNIYSCVVLGVGTHIYYELTQTF